MGPYIVDVEKTMLNNSGSSKTGKYSEEKVFPKDWGVRQNANCVMRMNLMRSYYHLPQLGKEGKGNSVVWCRV
jgi:hypothetical protein